MLPFKSPNARVSGRVPALLALLALIILLAACGGGDAPAETTVVAPAGDTATAEPTAEPPPTEAPPTEAPPTQVPPTEAPTATAEPTAAPVAEGGDCANAFFPVVDGRVLTYNNIIPGLPEMEFTQTFTNVTDGSFEVVLGTSEEAVAVQQWTCTADGLTSPDFLGDLGGAGLTAEYTDFSGVTLPTADQMTPGNEWTASYAVEGTLPDMGSGAMTMSQQVEMTHTVAGEESVTVPAGTFDAVRVDTAVNVLVTLGEGADALTTPVEMTMVSWYAEDVGLVRQEATGMLATGETVVTELVSITD